MEPMGIVEVYGLEPMASRLYAQKYVLDWDLGCGLLCKPPPYSSAPDAHIPDSKHDEHLHAFPDHKT